jgi:hypothetical protein
MDIASLVCNLENAALLKTAGVKQASYFCYARARAIGESDYLTEWSTFMLPQNYCAAFTAAELGTILPARINRHLQGSPDLTVRKVKRNGNDAWTAEYLDRGQPIASGEGRSEADAYAQLLFQCIGNGLLDPTGVENIRRR